MVDGASRLRVLFEIVLPLSAPALATTASATSFMWNEFLFALFVQLEKQTVPVAIALLRGQYQIPWGQCSPLRSRLATCRGAGVVFQRRNRARPRVGRGERMTAMAGCDSSPSQGVSERLSRALRLDLALEDGELMVLVGPIRLRQSTAAHRRGLESPSSGRVWIGERDVTGVRRGGARHRDGV